MGKQENRPAIRFLMMVDPRVPRVALGYCEGLCKEASPRVLEDKLTMLNRYVPDLVARFRVAS